MTLTFNSCVPCSIVSRTPPLRRTQNIVTISDSDACKSVPPSAGTFIFGALVHLCDVLRLGLATVAAINMPLY